MIEIIIAIAALCNTTPAVSSGGQYSLKEVDHYQSICQANLLRCVKNELNVKRKNTTLKQEQEDALSKCIIDRSLN